MSTLEALSLELEAETGCDSIPTIARIYEQTEGGSYLCCYPACRFKARDPVRVWRHIHFGSHGHSFGARSPEALAADRGDA